jgi:hypothetical protein
MESKKTLELLTLFALLRGGTVDAAEVLRRARRSRVSSRRPRLPPVRIHR